MAYSYKESNGITYIRYKDSAGAWRKRSCGKNATKKDVEFLEKKYTTEEFNRFHKAPVRVITNDLIDVMEKFRDTVLPRSKTGVDKQESSINREKSAFNNIIAYVDERGIKRIDGFDKETAQLYMDKRKDDKMGPKTLGEEQRLLKNFYKWALKNHFCTEDPTVDLVKPKRGETHPRYFTEEELATIFAVATGPYKLIFMFLYLTGLRTGELANLEWRDYDAKLKTLTIRIVSADKSKRTPGNKTKREETIPLKAAAIKVLEERQQQNDSNTFIFLNHYGHRLDNDNIYRNLKRVLTKKNIPNAHPHVFRHTFASHLAIKGVSIYTINDMDPI